MEKSVEQYLEEFNKEYGHCSWAVQWENHPHEEDGFQIVSINDSSAIIAHCDKIVDAMVIAMALNAVETK